MSYKIIVTDHFKAGFKKLNKKYPSLKDDIESVTNSILNDPAFGIPIGSGIYKIRVKIRSKNQGKSSGARLITYVYYKTESVYYIHIYDKSKIESIPIKDIQTLIDELNL